MEAIVLQPILKAVPLMEHEDKESRYRASIDDIRQVKHQLDVLGGKIGDVDDRIEKIHTAIVGNDMGTEGLVGQVKALKAEQEIMKKRLDEMELNTAKKNAYIMIAIGTAGLFLGGLITNIFRFIFKHP